MLIFCQNSKIVKDMCRINIEKLTLPDVHKVLYDGEKINIDNQTMLKISDCYDFLVDFAKGKVVYGINTGFGPMAQYRVDDNHLVDLQYNIIRSHSAGVGKPLDDVYVKAAMIARLGSIAQAHSGVHPEIVSLLVEFINNDIIPFVS